MRCLPSLVTALLFFLFLLLTATLPTAAQNNENARFDAESIGRAVSPFAAEGFSGTVLVSRGGEVIFQKGYGMAERQKKIPNSNETVYEIGSISKQFTAYAVTDLVVRGRMTFSDTLGKYFPDAPADKRKITVHQLLTHSSGLEMYHDREGALEKIDRAEALKRIFSQKLRFAPGERYGYSNSGYTLAGLIVEKVAGKDFREHIRQLTAERAGVKMGFYGERLWERDRVAAGHGFRRHGHPYERGEVSWGGLGAGYAMLSPPELHRWMRYLLTAEAREKYGRHLFGEYLPYTSLKDAKAFYGYGWVTLHDDRAGRIIYHNGGDTGLGYINTLRYYPGEDVVLIISSNDFSDDSRKIFDVKNAIEDLLYPPKED